MAIKWKEWLIFDEFYYYINMKFWFGLLGERDNVNILKKVCFIIYIDEFWWCNFFKFFYYVYIKNIKFNDG